MIDLSKFKDKDGVLNYGVDSKKKTDKFSKSLNLKAFYNGLNDFLIENEYKDILGNVQQLKTGKFQDGWAKKGEFISGDTNRARNMFEYKFILIKKEKSIDFEIFWKAFKKIPYSKYGWIEFELNLTNRAMEDREILDGNNKKILQSGTWEFRNKYTYKNNIINEYLNKIPIVKDSKSLKDFYLKYIYNSTLEADVKLCEKKIKPNLHNFILKHFG